MVCTCVRGYLRIGGPRFAEEKQSGEQDACHSAATPLVALRSAISLRVNGINSRPYSMASISRSKPRIRKWLIPSPNDAAQRRNRQ
jgi:hypothetical protein